MHGVRSTTTNDHTAGGTVLPEARQNAHADVQRFTAAGKGENAAFEFTVKQVYGSIR